MTEDLNLTPGAGLIGLSLAFDTLIGILAARGIVTRSEMASTLDAMVETLPIESRDGGRFIRAGLLPLLRSRERPA